MHQISFNTVHGLYQDLYAYREDLTDIVVRQLSHEDQRKVRLPLKAHIKKISVYKKLLAAQLSDRIIIFERHAEPVGATPSTGVDLQYHLKMKIEQNFSCNLLVLTAKNLVLCVENKLQMYSFTGEKEREWHLDALIRYIKAIGGPVGREGLLVGLKNGQVLLIFLDNSIPVQLIKLDSCVRCLDLSVSRRKLAAVDDKSTLHVFDLRTKQELFSEPNASSVAWNTDNEEMLCFSGNGTLSIKAGTFPCNVQKLNGFVVGFKGSKIYCLNAQSTETIDVPQSASLGRFLEKRDFTNAYGIACLGVTDQDWRKLGMDALESLQLDVARKVFVRLRDLKFLDLIDSIEYARSMGVNNRDLFLGDVYAYKGKYHEVSSGRESGRAISLNADAALAPDSHV